MKYVNGHFTTYEVENEKPKSMVQVMEYVEGGVNKSMVFPKLEYFSRYSKRKDWPMDYRWIGVYWVTGGSEGYYVHVDAVWHSKRELLFLGKVWSKEDARELVDVLTGIFEV